MGALVWDEVGGVGGGFPEEAEFTSEGEFFRGRTVKPQKLF